MNSNETANLTPDELTATLATLQEASAEQVQWALTNLPWPVEAGEAVLVRVNDAGQVVVLRLSKEDK